MKSQAHGGKLHKDTGSARSSSRLLKRNAMGVCGAVIVLTLITLSVFAPLIAPYDPLDLNMSQRLEPPSQEHWLGTDEAGRDIWSRILYGARITISMGVAIVLGAALFGCTVGLMAGFGSRSLDGIVMRTADVFMAFPYLLLAMLIGVILGPGVTNAVIALMIAWWPGFARLVRGLVLSIKQELYIEAAHSIGASRTRIAFRHLMPQTWGPVAVKLMIDIGLAMIAASSLSFIGLGPQAPSPEWGLMLANSRSYALTAWWYALTPGIALFLAALGFNLCGELVQRVLNPQTR